MRGGRALLEEKLSPDESAGFVLASVFRAAGREVASSAAVTAIEMAERAAAQQVFDKLVASRLPAAQFRCDGRPAAAAGLRLVACRALRETRQSGARRVPDSAERGVGVPAVDSLLRVRSRRHLFDRRLPPWSIIETTPLERQTRGR